jgi:predicted nucleic acid-binding protein
MSVVIDAPVTLAWSFQDEVTPATEALLQRVTMEGAVVPAHWKLEIANGFRSAERRGRIDREYRDLSLQDLGRLAITVDLETVRHAWQATLELADRFGLTPYDAAYLELALRRELPLGTVDRALLEASRIAGTRPL